MRRRLPLALAAALWLGGCGTEFVDGKRVDYRAAATVPPLEVPPDLTTPAREGRFAIPEGSRSSATLSAYQAERVSGKPLAAGGVLPAADNVRIERQGGERRLIVDEPVEKVWPVVKSFWQENGLLIERELPEAGILETDWAENRARIPPSFVGRLFSESMPELDKYRTRIERSADGKRAEITITHRGMTEVYTRREPGETVWQPRPPDPDLEAEFLARLMVRLGVREEKAQMAVAGAAPEPRANIRKAADGFESLVVPEPFDRAWRRVGLALDRVGFTVEDRDRQEGLYFVRYADPDAGAEKKEEESFFSRLAFWRSSDAEKGKPQRYRIEVRQLRDDSQVRVLDKDGTPDTGGTARRILALLHEQLK